VDFEDVKTVMTNGGAAIMGSAIAEGESRARTAIESALSSPLLNDNDIRGAKHILLYITFGNSEITMDEMGEITDYIQDVAGTTEHLFFGTGHDESLGNSIKVILIATGFKSLDETGINYNQPQRTVLEVENKKQDEIIEAINEEKFSPLEVEKQDDFLFSSIDEEEELRENQVEFPVSTGQANDFIKNEGLERVSLFEDENDAEKQLNTFDLSQATENKPSDTLNNDEDKGILFKPNERLQRLREISMKLKTPSGLKDLENESALKRRKTNNDDDMDTQDNAPSRMSISPDADNGYKLRENNSFLHDSVD